jgi:hypothetical protein
MNGTYTKIPQSTFNELQVDAGVLLTQFNPASPNMQDEDIICATTGGINPQCVPTYSDWGADVDNCPENMKELKHLDGWACSLGFTAINVTEETLELALGACTVDASTHKIKPDAPGLVNGNRFKDIWWVGDSSDGGFIAVCLKNGLSTAGLSLQTTKNGKGQLACTIGGHVSMSAQDDMPMEFYAIPGENTGA